MSKSVHSERMGIWVRIPSTYIKIQTGLGGTVTSALGRYRELTSPKESFWFNERPYFKTVRWRMTGRHLIPYTGLCICLHMHRYPHNYVHAPHTTPTPTQSKMRWDAAQW